MMAHELPISHQAKPNYDGPSVSLQLKKQQSQANKEKQQSKKKSGKNEKHERFLPNGDPVDFGGNKKNATKKSTSKKASNQPSLPDGSAPRFNNTSGSTPNSSSTAQNTRNRNKKATKSENFTPEPSLPNGEKPNFYNNENSDQSQAPRSSKRSEQSLPDGSKPNFNPGAQVKKNGKAKKGPSDASITAGATEETYAGSSFHSSPAALNLPKPSFKTSPKQGPLKTESVSPQQDIHQQNNQQSQPQPQPQSQPQQQQQQQGVPHHFGYQNGPMYPAVPYQHNTLPPSFPSPNQHPMIYRGNQFVQPGFTYQHSPQGYINYHMSNGQQAVPQGPFAAPPFPFTPQPPQQAPGYSNGVAQQGQKISFNELLDSSSK